VASSHHGTVADAPGSPSSPHGAEVFDVEVGGEPFVVLSLPLDTWMPACLSPSEREVALAVLGGLSNVEIARRRGTSSRTVANQLASIYRKVGVSSRSGLTAHLLGSSLGDGA
jgi:DNA-binding CsgD family transcriptional regulator